MHTNDNIHLPDFLVDRLETGIFAVDPDMRVVLWNRFMEIHSGVHHEEIIGKNLFACFPDLPEKWLTKKIQNVFILKNFSFTSWEHRPYLFRFHHNHPITGGMDYMQQNCTFLPVKNAQGEVTHVCIALFDYTDTALYQQRLNRAISELKEEKEEQKRLIGKLEEAQNQMLQSEKLASIGQLAAGVAHEINNPIGFVNSNLGSLDVYVRNLLSLLDAYQNIENVLDASAPERQAISDLKNKLDFDYLREDICTLIEESKSGLDRVKKIVQNLKDFSHVDASDEWQLADLHKGLDSTLNVVNNEIKYKAEVIREYGQLPEIECLPSQLNQVFMNLLVNAAHAIEERGTITIRTGSQADQVWVEVSDTGKGIAPEHIKKIFDPFFTTKPIGKGTGLGLSLSYGIIQKHHGRFEVQSEVGKGTTFRVWLPVSQPAADAPA